jgi:hypothetical protein
MTYRNFLSFNTDFSWSFFIPTNFNQTHRKLFFCFLFEPADFLIRVDPVDSKLWFRRKQKKTRWLWLGAIESLFGNREILSRNNYRFGAKKQPIFRTPSWDLKRAEFPDLQKANLKKWLQLQISKKRNRIEETQKAEKKWLILFFFERSCPQWADPIQKADKNIFCWYFDFLWPGLSF